MDSGHYKWIALSNTTLGVLLATLDASITLIGSYFYLRFHAVEWPPAGRIP